MAGRIKEEDIAELKTRVPIEDVVREHVTLRSAGPGRLKGLCPFHDEKTPSFTIRPAVGAWHCFGCNEGGDVISFVQRVDHLTFVEAVERLAAGVGLELHYEEGGGPRAEGPGRRTRLIEAHRVAEAFYHEMLLSSADARAGRDFLRARGFDSAVAARFQVGYAPRSGHELVAHLRTKGFSHDETITAGLCAAGRRGPYDRFRGRLVWPIRDITGDTVGFGARRLHDDDRIEAKYLNTAETPVYRKGSVLYGLDLAKRSIARDREVVVVEGYTDVMACHLSGVETAVATCGTSFGAEHITILRRLLRDESGGVPARTVFTFDGDAAGRKAAMRAFEDDQRWASQSFVAVARGGMDPCELRQHEGADAVRGLVQDAVPMFEFAVRSTLERFDLDTAEGRVQGIRAVAPIVAGIRDRALRPEYTRTVAGWIGVEVEQVASEVNRAARQPASRGRGSTQRMDAGPPEPPQSSPAGEPLADEEALPEPEPAQWARPDLRDPAMNLESQLLQVLLQHPRSVSAQDVTRIPSEGFVLPAHQAVFNAILAADPSRVDRSAAGWVEAVRAGVPEPIQGLVTELAVAAIRVRVDPMSGAPDEWSVRTLVDGLQERALRRLIADGTSTLRRMEVADPQRAHQIAAELVDFHRQLALLRSREV